MEFIKDQEKRILLSAISREERVIKEHKELAELIPVVTQLEFYFMYDRLFKKIYNQALEELLKVMKERVDDCSDIPNMFDKGYYQAYEHMCYEAEQLKK